MVLSIGIIGFWAFSRHVQGSSPWDDFGLYEWLSWMVDAISDSQQRDVGTGLTVPATPLVGDSKLLQTVLFLVVGCFFDWTIQRETGKTSYFNVKKASVSCILYIFLVNPNTFLDPAKQDLQKVTDSWAVAWPLDFSLKPPQQGRGRIVLKYPQEPWTFEYGRSF